VGLLPEGFGTVFALERLLPGVGSHVDLDVTLVQKSSVANLTMVHHLLLVEINKKLFSGSPTVDRKKLEYL
jgi:hypothetical protein